jgi:hypothetical protein
VSIRPRIRPLGGHLTAPAVVVALVTWWFVGPVGIEPTTRGLKVRCSAS